MQRIEIEAYVLDNILPRGARQGIACLLVACRDCAGCVILAFADDLNFEYIIPVKS